MALLLDPILLHSSIFSPLSISPCCNYIPWYIPKRTENTCLHKNLYQNVHSSIIPVKNINNLNVHQDVNGYTKCETHQYNETSGNKKK